MFLNRHETGSFPFFLDQWLSAMGLAPHLGVDVMMDHAVIAANREAYGVAWPSLSFADARLIVSIGADFLDAWGASVPQLVSAVELPSAVALNSIGINISRAIGPAIAGVLVAAVGPWLVFTLDALSCVGIIAVLASWRREPRKTSLPAERFVSAARAMQQDGWWWRKPGMTNGSIKRQILKEMIAHRLSAMRDHWKS